jgi:hypothetical protein
MVIVYGPELVTRSHYVYRRIPNKTSQQKPLRAVKSIFTVKGTRERFIDINGVSKPFDSGYVK